MRNVSRAPKPACLTKNARRWTRELLEAHLEYECSETGVRCVWKTPRGRTTALHTDLNREKLREARTATFVRVVGVIQEIHGRLHNDPTDYLALNRIEALREMYTGPYG